MVKSEISINYEANPSSDDLNLIRNGIFSESHLKRGLPKGEAFYFLCKDNNEKVVGGITGYILYGCLHIDELWIENKYRNQGLGSKLVIKAQEHGKTRNCNFSTVNTMDFEAKDFYEKLGYIVEFERKGYNKNTISYLLRKEYV